MSGDPTGDPLPVPFSLAKREAWSGRSSADLQQEGHCGIKRAVRMAEHVRSFKHDFFVGGVTSQGPVEPLARPLQQETQSQNIIFFRTESSDDGALEFDRSLPLLAR